MRASSTSVKYLPVPSGRQALRNHGQVVRAQNHVLRRHGDGFAVRRARMLLASQHEDTGLGLRLHGQRDVNGHLVAVEVGVERGAAQRVQLERAALDEHGLEGLDAQSGAASARG